MLEQTLLCLAWPWRVRNRGKRQRKPGLCLSRETRERGSHDEHKMASVTEKHRVDSTERQWTSPPAPHFAGPSVALLAQACPSRFLVLFLVPFPESQDGVPSLSAKRCFKSRAREPTIDSRTAAEKSRSLLRTAARCNIIRPSALITAMMLDGPASPCLVCVWPLPCEHWPTSYSSYLPYLTVLLQLYCTPARVCLPCFAGSSSTYQSPPAHLPTGWRRRSLGPHLVARGVKQRTFPSELSITYFGPCPLKSYMLVIHTVFLGRSGTRQSQVSAICCCWLPFPFYHVKP